jgi:hypothetical protein
MADFFRYYDRHACRTMHRYLKIEKVLHGVAAAGLEHFQTGIAAGQEMVDFAYHSDDHLKAIRTGFQTADPHITREVPWVKPAGASRRTKAPEGAGVVKWLPTLALLFLNVTFATLLRGDSFCMLTMASIGYVSIPATAFADYSVDVIRFSSRRSKTNHKAHVVLTYVSYCVGFGSC